ncbi:MAG: type II secretion system F family protein [Candidatus Anstonellales archaeon]
MIDFIPFLPLNPRGRLTKNIIRHFYPLSSLFVKLFPHLKAELEESEIAFDALEYVSSAFLSFLIWLIATLLILLTYIYATGIYSYTLKQLSIAGVFSFLLPLALFIYTMLYPRWIASKRRLELESDLLFALRGLLIQTSAGVSLYDALAFLSEGYEDKKTGYGEVGRQFHLIVQEVRGGKEFTQALEENAARHRSPYYRRVLWQLANANKSGANISRVLQEIVYSLSDEQRILIRNYGSKLNLLALLYMIFCIIAPTMAIIFLSIASSFVETSFFNEITLGTMLLALVLFQILFMGLIKTSRPVVAL